MFLSEGCNVARLWSFEVVGIIIIGLSPGFFFPLQMVMSDDDLTVDLNRTIEIRRTIGPWNFNRFEGWVTCQFYL